MKDKLKAFAKKHKKAILKAIETDDKIMGWFDSYTKKTWFFVIFTYMTNEFLMNKLWIMDIPPLVKGLAGVTLLYGYIVFLFNNIKRI